MKKLGRNEGEILWLITAPLVALGLRLYLLGQQSLWYDEGVTWYVSGMSLPDLVRWTAADIQPPFYYLVVQGFRLVLGETEFALRFPSVFFGVLLVAVLWRLARQLFGREPAFITAVLVSAAPVMVYFSQEARMYVLLVFEGALASLFLLRILQPDPGTVANRIRWPVVGYILTVAVALYTHYFAAFLLLGHGLFYLVQLAQLRFPRREVWQGAVIAGSVTLLFTPWLPTLLARLGDDPSYWPGALKLDEVGRKVWLSFTLGGAPEMVFERQAGLTMSLFALIFLGVLPLLFFRAPPQKSLTRRARNLFLMLWLVLPPLLVVLLSYQTPKFNPRYTLLGWPAFALILGGGLGFTASHLRRRWLGQGITALLFVSLAFIAFSWYQSLSNWFGDPRFSRADFKHVAQFIRERSTSDETVLLSSGHMFPVWAYYYGWEGWTPLPEMETLDVNRVTGFEIGTALRAGLAGHNGAWLVTWQDEVVDPNGVIPFLLDSVGTRPGDAGDFWGLGLEHWRLRDVTSLSAEPPIEVPDLANFGDQVELLGYTLGPGSSAEVMLFWRARQKLPDDLLVSLRLVDAGGLEWSNGTHVQRPAAYTFPPSRWPLGQVVGGRVSLPWLVGTPPGEYILEVGLLRESGQVLDVVDTQGRPQRRTARLKAISVRGAVQPAENIPDLPQAVLAGWESTVVLRQLTVSKIALEQGEAFSLDLLWQAGQFPIDDLDLGLRLRDSRGVNHALGHWFELVPGYPLPAWKPLQWSRGQYPLRVPLDAAPGPAELIVHLRHESPVWAYDDDFPVGTVQIQRTERLFELPGRPDLALAVAFEQSLTLLGADLSQTPLKPGQAVAVTLYWRAEETPAIDYTVFAHLLDSKDTVLVNADHALPRPTSSWLEGEIVVDSFVLQLPAELDPGHYQLEVGLYDAADPAFPRLSLQDGNDSRLILTTLEVTAS